MPYTCFSRYLAAKKTLDDRSLNRYVWETLRSNLPQGPLRVLEIGAGIGTMIERAVAWDLFAGRSVAYHAIDSEPVNLVVMEKRLSKIKDELATAEVVVSAETRNLFSFFDEADEGHTSQYDLIIAHAFLDLIDIAQHLDSLMQLLKPSGLLYATINFDGITSLQPIVDADLDARIEAAYHRTMDERIIDAAPSGDSQAGRHLLQLLSERQVPVLAAGSSDWVVHPVPSGGYVGDEAYFLHFIIDTMVGALSDASAIDKSLLEQWQTARHQHIHDGSLIYMAHQLDVLAQHRG